MRVYEIGQRKISKPEKNSDQKIRRKDKGVSSSSSNICQSLQFFSLKKTLHKLVVFFLRKKMLVTWKRFKQKEMIIKSDLFYSTFYSKYTKELLSFREST